MVTKKTTKTKIKTKAKSKTETKAKAKAKAKAKVVKKVKKETSKYLEAVGRRKTAVARVRFWTKGKGEFIINGKSYKEYFPISRLQKVAVSSLDTMKCLENFKTQVLVKGGGSSAQAEAVRHGTARVLVLFSPDFKKRLKKAGYLTRDPRMRERKKFGLKRARKAPQWQKR
jgi:small subunit ribosomal protein S9